jgi:hypothetical protein
MTKASELRPEDAPADVRELATLIGADAEAWFHNCHSASIEIVKSGLYPGARVARGTTRGVGGQHSWVVIPYDGFRPDGSDGPLPYHPNAVVLDATLWSYDPQMPRLYRGLNLGRHKPHGFGMIWDAARPPEPIEEPIELTPEFELSSMAKEFLSDDFLGPLDRRGWSAVANGPTGGWPSSEIILAMHQTKKLTALIPIDILGMLTDVNPAGLYLAGEGEQ